MLICVFYFYITCYESHILSIQNIIFQEKVSGFRYYSSPWNERLKEELKKDSNFIGKHAKPNPR